MGDRPLAVRCQSSLVLALEATVPPGRRPHTGLDVWTARLQRPAPGAVASPASHHHHHYCQAGWLGRDEMDDARLLRIPAFAFPCIALLAERQSAGRLHD